MAKIKGSPFSAWRVILEAAMSGHLLAIDLLEVPLHLSLIYFLVFGSNTVYWLTDQFSSLARTQ